LPSEVLDLSADAARPFGLLRHGRRNCRDNEQQWTNESPYEFRYRKRHATPLNMSLKIGRTVGSHPRVVQELWLFLHSGSVELLCGIHADTARHALPFDAVRA